MVCHVTLVDRPAQPAAAAVAAVGWESNDGGRAGPRVANMSAVLDKTQLMAQVIAPTTQVSREQESQSLPQWPSLTRCCTCP